jgi:hypothetical protein
MEDVIIIRKYLTAAEVARELRKTPAWVRAHSNGNRKPIIPSIKPGKERLYRPEAIDQAMRLLEQEERIRIERKHKRKAAA